MTFVAIVVGWTLASQLSGADPRYPFPPNGQSGATPVQGAGDVGGNAAGSPREIESRDLSPSGGGSNASRDFMPSGASPPRTLPLLENGTRPIPNSDSSRSTPAAYEVSPALPNNSSAQLPSGLSPSSMMRAMLSAQPGSQLHGQSITLMEVVAGARSRAEQTHRVELYWDLCSSVADYYLGLREQDELRRYVQRGGQAWDQFELEMKNRTSTAQRAALATQLRLASLLGRGTDLLPLPADTPHCASYHAHYDKIFPQGGPQEAKELVDLLPLRYSELKGAAAAVVETQDYLNSFATTRRNDIEGGLQALNLLALRRRAFVQIAREYNRRIARYTELATPGQVSPERLTGMLIKSPVSTATRSASPAPSQNGQSNRKDAPQTTFADGTGSSFRAATASGNQDASVRPASGEEGASVGQSSPRREHSLLVKPQE